MFCYKVGVRNYWQDNIVAIKVCNFYFLGGCLIFCYRFKLKHEIVA